MSTRTAKILLVNDKEYGIAGGTVRCAVNYNEFFVPLQSHFSEVHVLGRLSSSAGSLPFEVPGVTFHGVPTYDDYAQFLRRYRFGSEGAAARRVLEGAVAACDVVLLTVGCFFARDVERLCRKHRKPLVVEVIDDVLTAVAQTHKYRGLARCAAMLMAWRMDRYYRGLCKRVPSLVLGKELYGRYAPTSAGRCMEFFENIMEEQHYSFGRRLFSADKIRILFVGRLVHMKAVEDLIAAVAAVRDRGTSVECRVVGYGECLESLREQAKALQLEGQITFSGFVKYGDEMFSVYDWADVFVLPSVGGEGVPRVLIEALGRGCLVIATDVCGISTIVQNRVTGILVPPRRPDVIADEILSVAAEPTRTAALLAGARDFCMRHTRTKQIGRLVEFIEHARG